MKKTLNLFNDEIAVDTQKFLDGKLLLQANTGGGKSWATRRIIEQFAGVVPQIILDPEGEFFTLRQKFPDFILIGKGQKIVADPKSAGLLAHRIIEERISCIIDLLEMAPRDRDLFVKNFIQAMISAPRELWLPTLLTIDEAQIFAPEKGDSETASVLKDAGFRFRKRHFGLLLATPRISELSKSVASTCKNKLIGQCSLDNDMKRAASEIGFTAKEEMMTLRDLDPGEFYAYGPAFSKKVVRLKIGKTLTQHGDSSNVNARVAKPSEKVQKALEILASVPQAAAEEQKTVLSLQSELNAAKREIQRLGKPLLQTTPAGIITKVEADPKAIKQVILKRDAEWRRIVKVWKESYEDLIASVNKISDGLKKVTEYRGELVTEPAGFVTPLVHEVSKTGELNAKNIHSVLHQMINVSKKDPIPMPMPTGMPYRIDSGERLGAVGIGKGEMAVLNAIAQDDAGISMKHLAILTGYKMTSRRVYTNNLLRAGLIEKKDDVFQATFEGIAALGEKFERLPQGPELREYLLRTLPEGERKIFQVISSSPVSLNRQEIENAVNLKTTSVRVYLNKLIARKVITREGNGFALSGKLL